MITRFKKKVSSERKQKGALTRQEMEESLHNILSNWKRGMCNRKREKRYNAK